jgi:ribosomal protein L44E
LYFVEKRNKINKNKGGGKMSKPAYLKFKRGEKLTREEAIGAQCYECNGYSDRKSVV